MGGGAGGVGGGELTIMFLESLLLNSSVTITLTSYCLVPNAKDKAKKSYQEGEKKKTAKKTSGCHFCSQNPSLASMTENTFRMGYGLSAWKASLECFRGNGVRAI